MDLKRVALGLYRGSEKMANRFKKEALQRSKELERTKIDAYMSKLLSQSTNVLLKPRQEAAEDILMYSTLFQNAAQHL